MSLRFPPPGEAESACLVGGERGDACLLSHVPPVYILSPAFRTYHIIPKKASATWAHRDLQAIQHVQSTRERETSAWLFFSEVGGKTEKENCLLRGQLFTRWYRHPHSSHISIGALYGKCTLYTASCTYTIEMLLRSEGRTERPAFYHLTSLPVATSTGRKFSREKRTYTVEGTT